MDIGAKQRRMHTLWSKAVVMDQTYVVHRLKHIDKLPTYEERAHARLKLIDEIERDAK